MSQDMMSYALWRLGVNVSPEKRFATDQEVEVKVQRRRFCYNGIKGFPFFPRMIIIFWLVCSDRFFLTPARIRQK